MSGKARFICCCTLLAACGLALAADPPISLANRDDVAKISQKLALQLRSSDLAEQTKAVETIRTISQSSSRALSDQLPAWLDGLLYAKQYKLIEDLSLIAFGDRAYDLTAMVAIQKARVQAFVAQGKTEQGLKEAKSLYNLVTLKETSDVLKLVESISAAPSPGTRGEGRGEGSSPKPDLLRDTPESRLKSIKVDASVYDPIIKSWATRVNSKGQHSYSGLMGWGNALLLADKPEEAKKCFEQACQADDIKPGKNLREAVEGIARSIRDLPEGSPTLANNFINNLRNTPEIAGIGLAASVSANDLKTAAQQTVLATVQSAAFPALEEQRLKEEKRSAFSAEDVIKVATNFETAMPMRVRMISPTHYELTFVDSLVGNWFMFRAENVRGKIIRIDIKNRFGPLDNWSTFNPVYSYVTNLSDPDSYSTTASAGKVTPVAAWNGSGALLPDTSGQKWHYIPDVWRVDENTMAFVTKFNKDQAFVAMRIPYPPGFNERALRALSSQAQLIEVGKSKQGRPLLLMEIGSGEEKTKPCVLLYAGEHADEYDGLWAAHGAIEFLLSDNPEAKQLREQLTFLVIPQLDPDASADGHHEGFYMKFVTDEQTVESVLYSNWFQGWINSGNRLDLIFDLHNVQSRESGHVACALIEELGQRGELSLNLHKLLFDDFRSQRLSVIPHPWERGWSPDRLGGWLARRYGPICLAYELNSQAAERHLTLQELNALGAVFVQGAGKFLSSADRAKLLENVDKKRSERQDRWSRSNGVDSKLNAITAEARVSYGVGRQTSPSGPPAEKWVP